MQLRISGVVVGFVLGLSVLAVGQQPAAAMPPEPVPAGPDIVQQAMALADQPAAHTGFTFDRSELQVAENLFASSGVDPKRAAAALTGISFDTFHYKQPAFYTPEAMASLMEGYRLAGWKHLVNGNATPGNSAQPKSMITDLWLHYSGADIDALTVLTRGSKEMNVVRVTGDLRPLDLMKLSGHFGIPKVDPSAVMVPER
jgi:hypothetical protein